MKILDKIKKFFNSTEETKISMSYINELFSRNGGGEYGDDLGEVVYFVCLKVLSESLGKIPIYLLDAEKRRIMDHETMKVLQISTNKYQTPAQYFTISEFNRHHYGNSYSFINRRSDTTLESLIPLDPRYMQVWINNTGNFTHRFIAPGGNIIPADVYTAVIGLN